VTDGAFNMPWGTWVRIKRSSFKQLVGKVGTLQMPTHPATVANFCPIAGDLGAATVGSSWPVLAIDAGEWEFESVEKEGADVRVVLRDAWTEFAEHVGQTVRKIRSTKDDGMYAKLYADDAELLLVMLSRVEFGEGAGGQQPVDMKKLHEESRIMLRRDG
jgi:hypothetical protein